MKTPHGYELQNYRIPDHTASALLRYVDNKLEPGSFLSAVLENDLKNAVGNADYMNIQNLPAIVAWLYNEAPSLCWGYEGVIEKWINGGETK